MGEQSVQRLVLVRHAEAGTRASFDGPDLERPLTALGHRQAHALVAILATFDVGVIVSSPWLRCRQTVLPLSDLLGIPIEVRDEIGPDTHEQSALALLVERAKHIGGRTLVACTHGETFPNLLRGAVTETGALAMPEIEKAGRIDVRIEDGAVARAVVYPGPKSGVRP